MVIYEEFKNSLDQFFALLVLLWSQNENKCLFSYFSYKAICTLFSIILCKRVYTCRILVLFEGVKFISYMYNGFCNMEYTNHILEDILPKNAV